MAAWEQRYRGRAVSLRETQTHGCSEMLRRTTQHVNTKLLASEIPCNRGDGRDDSATRVLGYYDGGDTFVPPPAIRPPGAARRTREAPQAAGPGGGAEFVTEPRDHHIEDSPLSREFESTGDAVSTWDCSLYMGYRAVTGSGRFRTGVKSIRHWSRFTSQAFVKRHYIKLHT